ncbi:hypothetical protein [Chryseobacterium sp.]|uniref:hypothetical protein n=2 Tax=Chryseobacterium sp. TaxID=1871047 RepID=UPI002FC7F994
MMIQKQKTIIIYSVVALLIGVAVVGNLFSKEFNWSSSDFLIAGIILLGTALIIDTIHRIVKNRTYKFLLFIAVLFVMILIWVELAVGFFGTPFAGT